MDLFDREARRETFDQVATKYEAARPGYPDDAISALVRETGMGAAARCLEVGIGTGQATRSLATYGCAITGLEPGPDLARVARQSLGAFSNVDVVSSSFEDYVSPPGAFDLLYSATAFHWTDPQVRWNKTASLVKAGGHVAMLTNKSLEGVLQTDFQVAAQVIYQKYQSERRVSKRQENTTATIAATLCREIEDHPCFEVMLSAAYPFDLHLTSTQVIDLQMTFSDHLRMDVETRTALHRDLKALIDIDFGGNVTKPYEAALVVARRD